EYSLALVLAHLGRFDEAIGHAEAGLRIAEEADHPWTLYYGSLQLGSVHLGRGDFARAARVLERSLDLGRTWQFVDRIPEVAAVLGVAYALTGRTEEALALVAGAVKAFRARQGHGFGADYIPYFAGRGLSRGGADRRGDQLRPRGLSAHAPTRWSSCPSPLPD